MKNYKLWTKEEEEILVQAVKANPHNLQQCFREITNIGYATKVSFSPKLGIWGKIKKILHI